MKHRTLTATVFALVVCGITAWMPRDAIPDPNYRGKRASQWLWELDCGDPLRQQQASNAFAVLGPKALPVLKAALDRSDSRLRRALMHMQGRAPRMGLDWYSSSAPEWWRRALDAAVILGTNALPILPELADVVGADCGAAKHVKFLASFNENAVLPLTAALTNSGFPAAQRDLLDALNLILADHELSDQNQEIAISALVTVLQENLDGWVDYGAARAIAHFGAKAERAIPVLLDCVTNREGKSSDAAVWALRQIERGKSSRAKVESRPSCASDATEGRRNGI